MTAVVYTRYGPPDGLRLTDVSKPVPQDGEVLVRVHTASINAWDLDLLRGRPYLTRLGVGLRSPKQTIIGADIAGQVESVGAGVAEFAPDDAVFGDLSDAGWGGFAEYVSVRQSALAHIPEGVSFPHAAAIPQASVLALQALRKAPISPGQHVLIIDMVMHRSLFKYWRALAPNGSFVVVGGATSRILQTVSVGTVLSRISGKKLGLLIHRPNRKDLITVGEMVASGAVTPVIDRTYPLADLPDAFRYFGAANAKGKVVISIAT